MARKKASGPGSNSRRFAEIRRPDGSIDKVPAARDAATYIFLADEQGDWPRTFVAKFLYDATWMNNGEVFELEDMRPGNGMGSISTCQIVETRSAVQVYPNGHGQVRRLVLVTEILGTHDLADFSDLELEEFGTDGDVE